ncbi:GntR family transcriptional regulator [Sciscionella marina]|uniref:GntR family transcriptional regulator n=1 Tax=Sciscionella marina TaxID=508770 RepID=UPI0003603A11|nr:GntR family transcriptional regulator [Sciscionella marina]
MDRREQGLFGKRNRLIADLTDQIHSGRLSKGDQLPGEHQLAQRYSVSRGTVRGALDELKRRRLIATEMGVGSFVAFDGVPLDQDLGWATALADSGFSISTELLGIERVTDASLTERFGIQEFIAVRRLRREQGDGPVSLEHSLVPAQGALAELPERGLRGDSLTASLAEAGLRADMGEQWIDTAPLDEESAQLLERAPGEVFLQSVRCSTMVNGRFVEHVTSLLDPHRFQFHLTFGNR